MSETVNPVQALRAMGLTLPAAPKPVASYVPGVLVDGWLQVSGQLPLVEGRLVATGRVPSQVTVEQAREAAGQCVLNGLAIVSDMLAGNWDRLLRVVKVQVFVAGDPDFAEQHMVANGASDLLVAVLGDRGRHARAAVGVAGLPLNAPVEIDLLLRIRS